MVNFVHQGDILRFPNNKDAFLVLSKDFLNQTGMSILCPLITSAPIGSLRIAVSIEGYNGYTKLEALKGIDLSSRHYQVLGQLSYDQIQNVSDAVQGLFAYYPF